MDENTEIAKKCCDLLMVTEPMNCKFKPKSMLPKPVPFVTVSKCKQHVIAGTPATERSRGEKQVHKERHTVPSLKNLRSGQQT